ncbi:MAG TPA: DUF1800 family protein [Xanthobacteraceae bacterium]|nr:DUF1800 family protein [Xanthobacteraceae bacterium]
MAPDRKAEAALALHRFGFGPRIGSIAAIASDPRGALVAELDRPGAGRTTDPDLPGSGAAGRAAFSFLQERRAARKAEQEARKAAAGAMGNAESTPQSAIAASASPATAAQPTPGDQMAARPKPDPGVPQKLFLGEAKGRVEAALGAELGFVERLVWFWSNHFCVSADKNGEVRAIAGAYEREAIRPHVVGRFADMLRAAETHPAMLLYLDNVRSIGPASVAGQNQHKGLNENLAREILELHTLGVRSVYDQDDVTNFAKIITGWTIVPFRQDPVHGGEFTFNPRMHEPGAQTVIGKTYAQGGVEQGQAVLADLARHPATARHVADKLVRHFVTDQPPPPLVERLAQCFLDTGGNLREVARALVMAPEAWAASRAKLKRPGEWIVAALRATGVTPPDIQPVMQAQNMLGEPLWRPPAPRGFSDDTASWMDGLSERLDVATQLAGRVAALVDPPAVVETALGPLASAETRAAVARAESRPQALALLLMSAEFQRR